MPMAFILTDGTAKILHTNAKAADMLDGCPLLCLDDQLAARHGQSDAALRSAITNAARIESGARQRNQKVISLIVTGPASHAIKVWVMPIAGPLAPSFLAGTARVAVFARAIDGLAEKTIAGDAASSLAAALTGSRPASAAYEQHLIARLADALQEQARPRSVLSRMRVLRRAERLGKPLVQTFNTSPEH